MLNLAVSLEGQNKNFEEIEELYLKVVKGRKIILGDNHPRYLHSLKLLCLFFLVSFFLLLLFPLEKLQKSPFPIPYNIFLKLFRPIISLTHSQKRGLTTHSIAENYF